MRLMRIQQPWLFPYFTVCDGLLGGAFNLDYGFYSINSQTDFSKSTLQFYFFPIPKFLTQQSTATTYLAPRSRNLSSSHLSTINLSILTILIPNSQSWSHCLTTKMKIGGF